MELVIVGYLAALEAASVRHDITPFTRFVGEEMAASQKLKGARR
jgi:hypothetical protein